MEVTSRFVAAIDQAIKDNKLQQCFKAVNLIGAIPPNQPPYYFAYNTYNTFLPKHEKNKARDNKVKAYFERVGKSGSGLYRRCCN